MYDKSQFFLPNVCKSWLLWYSIYIIITIVYTIYMRIKLVNNSSTEHNVKYANVIHILILLTFLE